MRRVIEGPYVQVIARLILAAVFTYAALPKIGDPAGFARDIANYRLLPPSLVPSLAVTLPWVELAVALLLALGVWTRAAALLAGVMLLAFTGAMTAAVARGLNIECGCFGRAAESGDAVGWGTLARDLVFIVPAVLVLVFDKGRYGASSLVGAKR